MRSYSRLIRHPGNSALFGAIELSVLATLAGWPLHLHAEGLRGTGKTTIIRSIRSVLPRISRIKGCAYNCDPATPHCPDHASLSPAEVEVLGSEEVALPFLEISHSAKVGTVAGSIDLARLTDHNSPYAAVLPGTLARAHRGIVFVDEINRLADTSPELTDILLDAMGTRPGRLQIEEVGLPTVELPLRVSVWAASNPDEDPGPLEDIRRQLSDRFDLHVCMGRIRSRDVLMELLSTDTSLSELAGSAAACRYPEGLLRRAAAMDQTWLPGPIQQAVAELYLECNLESLRTIEATQIAARAACAWRGGGAVAADDLRRAVPLVIGRRADPETIGRFLARLGQDGVIRPPAVPGDPGGHKGPAPVGAESEPAWYTRTSEPAPRGANEAKPAAGGAASRAPAPAIPPRSAGQAEAAGESRDAMAGQLGSELTGDTPDAGDLRSSRPRSWLRRMVESLLSTDGWGGTDARPSTASPGFAGAGRTSGDSTGGGLPPSAPPRRGRPLADVPLPEVLRMPGDDGYWHED